MSTKHLSVAMAAIGLAMGSAQGATYYLHANSPNDSVGNNWNNTTKWFSDPVSGTAATTMTGHNFSNNGYSLRASPGSTAASGTFNGASLTLDRGSMWVRANTGGTTTVGTVFALGGTSVDFTYASSKLAVTNFDAAGTTVLNVGLANSGEIAYLDVGALTGTGTLELKGSAGRTLQVTATNAGAYTGNLIWTNANAVTLQFGNALTSGGGLVAQTTSRINLTQNVSFASVKLGNTQLTPGTYSYAYLNSPGNFDAMFIDGGAGSITVVPEPASLGMLALGAGCLLRRRR